MSSTLKNILGTPIPPYVATQINKRQADQGSGVTSNRSADQISILNSSTSWVKMASGADVATSRLTEEGISETGGTALAKKYMLFGGTESVKNSGFPDSYSVGGNEYGLTPMPGIESIDVQYINRGSVRKAIVNFKVYNKTQLTIIDFLYLRLGYYVMLEWGNSLYRNNSGGLSNMGNTLIDSEFFTDSFAKKSIFDTTQKINEYRDKYSGNYDGLLGRVTNFEWSNNGEVYDVSLTLTSAGDVIESLKLNIQANEKEIKFISDVETALLSTPTEKATSLESPNDPAPTKDKLSTYLFIQKLLFRQTNKIEPDEITYKINEVEIKIGSFIELTETITIEAAPPPKEPEEGSDPPEENPPPTEVTPSEPKNFTLPISSTQNKLDVVYLFYSNAEELEPNIPQDLGFYIRFGHLLEYIQKNLIPAIDNNGTKSPLVNIEYGDVNSAMYYVPGQISFDPRICIVNSKLKDITAFPQLKNWTSINHAYPMSIYISFTQIQQSLEENIDEKGDIGLFSFLSSICEALNVALGGVNNLEPVIDEDSNTLKIIDSSYTESPKGTPYKISLYGYQGNTNVSNFVRNINLKSKLPPELQTQVQIAATGEKYTTGVEGTMLNTWNEGITDRIFPKITDSDKEVKIDKNGNDDAIQNYVNNFYAKGKLALGYLYNSSGLFAESPELDNNAIDSNVSIATEFYKYLQFRIAQKYKGYNSPIQGFVPIDLGLTIDGLAGFKIYNNLQVDTNFLPNNYPKSMRFLLSNIRHSVSNQDWETTLETVMLPENYDENGNLKVSFADISSVYEALITEGGISSIKLDSSIPIYQPPVLFAPGGGVSGEGINVNAVGGTGPKSLGTYGTAGASGQVSPDALSITSINDIVRSSGTSNELRRRIVQIAASYVGQTELPGDNIGWYDIRFESKMLNLKQPWYKGGKWCNFFTNLVWVEAYTTGNALVPPTNSYKNIWISKLGNGGKGKPLDPSVFSTYEGFAKLGQSITIAQATAGTKLPEPGDMVMYGASHIEIVVATKISGGKLTGLSTIGGNTSTKDKRDGGGTKYKPNVGLGDIKGFGRVIF